MIRCLSAVSWRRLLRWPFVSMLVLVTIGVSSLHAQRLPASVIVRLRPGISPKAAQGAVAAAGARLGVHPTMRPVVLHTRGARSIQGDDRLDRYIVVDAADVGAAELASALHGAEGIEDAFPNHIYHIDAAPNDSLYPRQWALAKIEAEGAWEITGGDSSVIVGVVDTGIEFDHPDLAGAFAVNAAEDINHNGRLDPDDINGRDDDGNGFVDDVIGFDFVDQRIDNIGDWEGRDPVPADELGHGTDVAGVIAARADNRIGVAGLARATRLLALRAFDETGNAEDDDIAAAIVYGVDRGAKVLNLSFGDYYESPLLHDAISYAYHRGVTVVTSSGNEGGSDPHYPSNFPEVIAVGATGDNDLLADFSTMGSQLSITAPGVGIFTTALDSGYAQVSGTSFSSPYAAAAAALLLSLHPAWTPDEVRSALELSADDRGAPGFDDRYGAGRLNVRRALETPGPPSVAIFSPAGDVGLPADTTVVVTGSAMSALIASWELSIGAGEAPTSWNPIGGPVANGHVADSLGVISTRELSGGIYTLRLLLRQTDGHQTERRVRLFIGGASPRIVADSLRNVWRFAERAVAVTLRTDQLTRAAVWLRRADHPSENYRPVALEAERSGWVNEHVIFLTSDEMVRGVPYDLYIVATNRAGDTAMIGSPTAPLTASRESGAFPIEILAAKDYGLPYGYLLDQTAPLFADGGKCVALNRFEGGTYGRLMLYEFEGGRFVARDSSELSLLPRGFGDSNGDGLLELLAQAGGSGIIYEQPSAGASPLKRIAVADSTSGDFWPSRLADLDGDGADEVIARTDNNNEHEPYYYVARREGSTLRRLADLPNATPPAEGDARNKLGASESAVADFDGDGIPEILVGDDDADFMIFKRTGDGLYQRIWTDRNVGFGGSEMVAAADIDGDGRAEAIVAFHSRTGLDDDHEYEPPFWTAKAFKLLPDGRDTLIWSEQFAYQRPRLPNLLFSGISTGDLDRRGGSEVAISIYPNTYVFTWDSVRGTLAPFWWRGGTNTNKPIIADFDGDGTGEIGVGDGESISFFSLDTNFRAPAAPTGLDGWAVSDAAAYLEWNPVADADYYTLYRGVAIPGGLHFDSVAVTRGTSLTDTGFRLSGGLRSGQIYYYVVTTRDTSMPLTESGLSGLRPVFIHPRAQVLRVEPIGTGSIRVTMSARVREDLYRAAAFDLFSYREGLPVAISSIVTAGHDALIITLADARPGDSLLVEPSPFFRDYYDAPADTEAPGAVVVMPSAENPGERFIATRASLRAPDTIVVEFNAPVDPTSALDPAIYTLAPDGEIVGVTIDPADPSRVLLVVSHSLPIGPLGRYYAVTVTGVRAIDGRVVNDGAGSVVGFSIDAGDLSSVFIYPQPFSISRDQKATFAGLTRSARVTIFTQEGRPVRTLATRDGDGGVDWNGDDDAGHPLPAGIYLFKVTGIAADGASHESDLGKIAVVP